MQGNALILYFTHSRDGCIAPPQVAQVVMIAHPIALHRQMRDCLGEPTRNLIIDAIERIEC